VTRQPPKHVRNAIHEAQRHRGWIANGYAQVEYLFGDIIMRAFKLPEYADLVVRLPHRVGNRIELVNKIVEIEGFFKSYGDEIRWVIEAFELRHETRNILAHGFCTVLHTPDDDIGFQFRKWHRDVQNDVEVIKIYRLVDLEYEKAQLVDVSERALKLSYDIDQALGLVGT
jgi:hypothetical protein